MSTLEQEIIKFIDLSEAGVPMQTTRGTEFNTLNVVPPEPAPGGIRAREEELVEPRQSMFRFSAPGSERRDYSVGELPEAIGRATAGVATGVVGTIAGLPGDVAGLVKGGYDAAVAEDGERLEAFLAGLSEMSEKMGSAAFEREAFEAIDVLPMTSDEKRQMKDSVRAGLLTGYIFPSKAAAGAVPTVARKIKKGAPQGDPELGAVFYGGRPRPQNRRAFVRVYHGTPLTLGENEMLKGKVFTSSAPEVAETYRRGGEVYELDIDTTDFATVDFSGNLFNRGPNFSSTFVTLPSGKKMNLSRLAQEKGIDWRTEYGEAPTTDQVVEFIQRALPEAKGVNITNVIDRGPSVGGSDDMPYSSLVKANKPQNVHVAFDDTTLFAPGPPVADIDELGLFSNLEQQIANQKADKFKPEQLRGTLLNAGVKEDELLWTGFDEYLEGKETVTKEQALDYIRGNKVLVTEKTLEPADEAYETVRFDDEPWTFEDDEYLLDEVAYDRRPMAKDPDEYEYEYVMSEYGQRYTGVTDEQLGAVLRGEVEDDIIEENIMEILKDADRESYRTYRYQVTNPGNMPDYEMIGNEAGGYDIYSPDNELVASGIFNFDEANVQAQQHALDYGLIGREGAQYEEYRQSGGENYREILLKSDEFIRQPMDEQLKTNTPAEQKILDDLNKKVEENGGKSDVLTDDEVALRSNLLIKERAFMYKGHRQDSDFTGSHFGDERNVVSHVRVTDRRSNAPQPNLAEGQTDYGSDVLYIDELQSDWGQQGRKQGLGVTYDKKLADELKEQIAGTPEESLLELNETLRTIGNAAGVRYRGDDPSDTTLRGTREYVEAFIDNVLARKNSAIPPGPFVGATEKWTELSLKRIIRKAAEEGYHYVAWAPGQVHVDRWNEEGLKTFYDNVLPKVSNKVLSKLDKEAKVQVIDVDIDGTPQDTLAIPITDAIKQKTIKIGQPMFTAPAGVAGAEVIRQTQQENEDGAVR